MDANQIKAELIRRELAKRQGGQAQPNIEAQRNTIKLEGEQRAKTMLDADPMARGMARTPELIEERGSLFPNIKENLQSPNWLRKGIGVAQAVGAPAKMVEGAVANPMLSFQRGENNPIKLMKESGKGFTGQKQGEFGDLYRNVGAPESVAATAGFGLGVGVPAKVIGAGMKAFRPIAKMSDKGIRNAGINLEKAVDSAENFTGGKVDSQFGKLNTLPIDQNVFVNETSKIPKNVLTHIEEELGQNIETLQPTVANLRKVTQALGRIGRKAFGKKDGGLGETLDEEKINRAYGGLKNLLHGTVKNNAGDDVANQLIKAEEGFADVKGAGNLVKKAITNKDLRKPTKAGNVAAGLEKEGDFSVREALNILKNSGKESKKSVTKAVDTLKHFNRMQSIFGALKKGAGAITYGGAVGAAGGMMASKLLNKRGGSDG